MDNSVLFYSLTRLVKVFHCCRVCENNDERLQKKFSHHLDKL